MEIKDKIERLLPDRENYIIGYANLSGLLKVSFKPHEFAIVLGKRLDDKIIDSIINGPTKEYFNLYNETNDALYDLSKNIADLLNNENISTIIMRPKTENYKLDKKTLRTDFSHKMAATRAGIGWIGKTALLISYKFGPRLRLATILTDHEISEPGTPVNESQCKECNLCVDICPAKAANGKLWNYKMQREEFFNAHRCRYKCRQLCRINLQIKSSLCGICISVCPTCKK